MARIVALMAVAVLAATPAAALAAGGARSLLQDNAAQQQPAPAPVQTTPVPQPTRVESGSIGARETLLIALGVVALIGGIWFAIARDARRATAGRLPSQADAPGSGRGGSATRAARRGRRLSAEERRRRRRGRATK